MKFASGGIIPVNIVNGFITRAQARLAMMPTVYRYGLVELVYDGTRWTAVSLVQVGDLPKLGPSHSTTLPAWLDLVTSHIASFEVSNES